MCIEDLRSVRHCVRNGGYRKHRPHPQAVFQTVQYSSGFIEEELNKSQGILISVIMLSTLKLDIGLRF